VTPAEACCLAVAVLWVGEFVIDIRRNSLWLARIDAFAVGALLAILAASWGSR